MAEPYPLPARLPLPLGQLLQNLLKLLGRVVHTTTARSTCRSCRACHRANICEGCGEKAASNLVEVGVRNSSIVVLVDHGPLPLLALCAVCVRGLCRAATGLTVTRV